MIKYLSKWFPRNPCTKTSEPDGISASNVEMSIAVLEPPLVIALIVLWTVVDNRPVGKCCPKLDPDAFRNVSQLIRSRGYPVEEHAVVTEDHFILGVQRIPRGRAGKAHGGSKPVVFLLHGLLGDSSNWVQNYPDDSLGYILADSGYDVWLGNIRGNRYSRRNRCLRPWEPKFWDWSFQEMASLDIPAMLEYALNVTGESQLYYVGHSQGSLVGFLAFSTIPEIAKKVKLFFALAPVFQLNHSADVLIDAAFALQPYEQLFHPLGETEIFSGRFVQFLLDLGFCENKLSRKKCYDIAETIFGPDDRDNNMSRVPVYMSNWPAGTSFKNVIHFSQIITSGKCRMFDYGRKGNLEHYHQDTPPGYDVTKMTTPTAFFYGGNDGLANATDVRALIPQISNLIIEDFIREYNHIDFVFGIDAGKVLYSRILAILEDHLMKEQ